MLSFRLWHTTVGHDAILTAGMQTLVKRKQRLADTQREIVSYIGSGAFGLLEYCGHIAFIRTCGNASRRMVRYSGCPNPSFSCLIISAERKPCWTFFPKSSGEEITRLGNLISTGNSCSGTRFHSLSWYLKTT